MSNVQLRPLGTHGVRLVCVIVAFVFLVVLLAYQRFLLVEARLMSINLTRQAIAAEYWLRNGDNERATEMVREAQDWSVNYLLHREIMFLYASDITSDYRRMHGAGLTLEANRKLEDYSNEVIDKCSGEKANFYSVVDHWLLPEIFGFFVPVEQNPQDAAKQTNPVRPESAVRGER